MSAEQKKLLGALFGVILIVTGISALHYDYYTLRYGTRTSATVTRVVVRGFSGGSHPYISYSLENEIPHKEGLIPISLGYLPKTGDKITLFIRPDGYVKHFGINQVLLGLALTLTGAAILKREYLTKKAFR